MEHSYISRMLEVATVAARLAGQLAMEEIKYTTSDIKNGSELVTLADTHCQKIITDRIKETYPDHGFIGEESADGGFLFQPPRSSQPIWWVIDPIDGTNNYAHGILDFTVSIAAFHEGRPIVGVIFDPATDSMFTAAKDTDAQLNASRINASDEDISKFASIAIDGHYTPEMAPAISEVIKATRFRNLGSTALHLAYVAKGSMVAAITAKTKIWDIAAGVLIIENAGGIVTDHSGNPPFPIDNMEQAAKQSHPIIAANKTTHKKILELLKK